jgi:hypothetical protein
MFVMEYGMIDVNTKQIFFYIFRKHNTRFGGASCWTGGGAAVGAGAGCVLGFLNGINQILPPCLHLFFLYILQTRCETLFFKELTKTWSFKVNYLN